MSALAFQHPLPPDIPSPLAGEGEDGGGWKPRAGVGESSEEPDFIDNV
jgi:hypothetical protein